MASIINSSVFIGLRDRVVANNTLNQESDIATTMSLRAEIENLKYILNITQHDVMYHYEAYMFEGAPLPPKPTLSFGAA